jgi:hypothetical protein
MKGRVDIVVEETQTLNISRPLGPSLLLSPDARVNQPHLSATFGSRRALCSFEKNNHPLQIAAATSSSLCFVSALSYPLWSNLHLKRTAQLCLA